MNRFLVVVKELEKSERLVADALRLTGSLEALQKPDKESIESLLREARESLNAAIVFGRACGKSAGFFEAASQRRFTAAGRERIGIQG